MVGQFDLVVIGTGVAASVAAKACRSAGWEVAVVDSRPFGGTCVLRGCDPKKVLRRGAEVVDAARRMAGRGVGGADGVRVDWPALMRFKRTFTDPVPRQREESFAEAGIAAFHGRARFVDRTTIRVGDATLRARHVLIASGAKPVPLDFPGAEHLTTSDAFIELDELPGRIVFVGGGYISFEFAHMAARAGARVTMLDRHDRPLRAFDSDLVDRLVAKTRGIGVDFRPNAGVEAIEARQGRLVVRASVGGAKEEIGADLVVHGAGRAPEIDDLDLDAAGVERVRKGVRVNDYLQSTSNPAVYAAGDAAAAGGPPLTPTASLEGSVAARNMLEGNRHRPNYAGLPSVVFTIPPLAFVGLREADAREQGLAFRVGAGDMSGWYSARRVGEDCAGYKMLIAEGSGRILGAHLLGPGAEETINLFALAVRTGLRASDLEDMLTAYPSHGSDAASML